MLRRHSVAISILMGMIVGISRLSLAVLFAGNFPSADNFDVNFDRVYAPFMAGRLTLYGFFSGPGEHIQALPRLLDFTILWLTGNWNIAREAEIHSLILMPTTALLVYAYIHLSSRPSLLSTGVITLLLALPITFFNTLMSTGDVYTLSILFSLLAFWYACRTDFPERGVVSALFMGCCAYLSLGSGLLTLAVILGTAVLLCFLRRRRVALALFVSTILVIAALRSWRWVSGDLSEAGDLAAFETIAFDHLTWPDWPLARVGTLIWIPFFVCLWYQLVNWRNISDPAMLPGRFAMMLYAWVLLIILATAYQRPYFAGTGVQYRYFDVMLLLIIAAFFTPRWPAPALLINGVKIALALWTVAWSIHLWPQAMFVSRSHSRMAEIEQETFRRAKYSEDEAWQYFSSNETDVERMMWGGTKDERVARLWLRLSDPIYRRLRGFDHSTHVDRIGGRAEK